MKVKASSKCPNCGTQLGTQLEIDPTQLAPIVRSNLRPSSSIMEYKFTSDEIKQYLIDKARRYVKDVQMEVVPRYCEKKRRRRGEARGSFASLRIAFSEDVIEKNAENGWFGKIGEGGNTRVVASLFKNFIQLFQYNKDNLKKIIDNYKYMEELEDTLGITEAYLKDLMMYATPRVVPTNNGGKTWVFFSAAAEKVIADMLTVVETGELPGVIEIHDIIPLSKESVQYVVYVHPGKDVQEDPTVRKILLGEEKAK